MDEVSVPGTMKAWLFETTGEPSQVLTLEEVPVPRLAGDQVLVEVDAAAVNFSDALVVRGQYQSKPPLPAVAGMEIAGRVVAAGPGSGLKPGAPVAGLTTGLVGAFAEYAVLDGHSAFEPPAHLSPTEAACFAVAYQTAWFAVHVRGVVAPGEAVLVHSAAGGVGLAAVQLAAAAGARVIGVVGSKGKVEAARSAGCEHVFLRGAADLVETIKDAVGGSVDLVVDPVGGPAHEVSERAVGFDGRIVLVGFASGQLPAIRPDLVMVKNFSVVGLHWGLYRERARSVVDEQYRLLRAEMERHQIRPTISWRAPFSRAPEAISRVEEGRSVGRVLVRVSDRRGLEP